MFRDKLMDCHVYLKWTNKFLKRSKLMVLNAYRKKKGSEINSISFYLKIKVEINDVENGEN